MAPYSAASHSSCSPQRSGSASTCRCWMGPWHGRSLFASESGRISPELGGKSGKGGAEDGEETKRAGEKEKYQFRARNGIGV
ncbi:hypothetical protein PAHAL_7G053200 [Panicum hallii]|uniref:Uncharacterized protein n=1 Tax=Panicum hallii TaxID=206008 RepID=A0A2T8IB26_9POAL|nr:hypothetical protein PAHAL_7G053200 [Panicum hallii]